MPGTTDSRVGSTHPASPVRHGRAEQPGENTGSEQCDHKETSERSIESSGKEEDRSEVGTRVVGRMENGSRNTLEFHGT